MLNSKSFFIKIFCTLILLLPAIINGYPIVYSDTSTYLASGFEIEMPFDRPITYGLFIRLFSLNGISLWFVIFFQTIILVSSTNKLLTLLNIKLKVFHYLLLYFLFLFSGIGWTCSQIIADIFTPILILSLLIILLEKNKPSYLYYLLFATSTSMHLSHFGINILLILFLVSIKLFLKSKPYNLFTWKSLTILFVLSLISFSSMLTPYSKSKHVFLFGAFIEHGIIQEYLKENCSNSNFKICKYKDSLPNNAVAFIWDQKSPFYKIGGFKGTKKEFNEIIFNTLTSKKYLWLHLKVSAKVTLQQLISFSMGDGNGRFSGKTLLNDRIQKYFPKEYENFKYSLQNSKNFNFLKTFNIIQSVFLFIVFIFLGVFMLTRSKSLDISVLLLNRVLIYFIIIHSASCGILANIADRYGCRIIWLLPLLLFINLYANKPTRLQTYNCL